jgi:hypothetical protein
VKYFASILTVLVMTFEYFLFFFPDFVYCTQINLFYSDFMDIFLQLPWEGRLLRRHHPEHNHTSDPGQPLPRGPERPREGLELMTQDVHAGGGVPSFRTRVYQFKQSLQNWT